MPLLPTEHVPLSAGDILLRDYTPADLPALLTAFADEDITRWNPGPAGHDAPAAAATWMERRNDWSGGDHASWAVAGLGGSLVGSVSLHKFDIEQGDAEVGYWIAPWARGRGTGTQALAAAALFAFTELQFHRLHLYRAVDNVRSCRVAAAAGFALEGRLRQSCKYADGHYHDEHLHARLASDPPN